MTSGKTIGSLIGLKKDHTEQYIILHQNVFPAVLDRIARSGIANYSIFVSDGMLFGIYDYRGGNYVEDMKAIGDDPATQQWWKLTAPLQEALPFRKEGEWWAGIEHILSRQSDSSGSDTCVRRAFRIPGSLFSQDDFKAMEDKWLKSGDACRLEVFRGYDSVYLYLEGPADKTFGPELQGTEMTGVFHTEGCARQKKKVFVTGCFDMLHSGHVAFLKEASAFGDLHVGIGSDANVHNLKGRYPVNTQAERKYMLDSVRYVYECRVNQGWGIMDFLEELEEIRPDVFVVNEDGHTPEKDDLCRRLGIDYKVLRRIPEEGLPARSTTALREECRIPFRIDLAGGWLDQPFVSKHFPGPVLTVSIEPTLDFNDRSGMASSTRRKAIEIWKNDIPNGDPEQLARMLFSYDNPPGTENVSGSQDALGIVLPGLNRLDYNGSYWPHKISSVNDDAILIWLESHLFLVTLGPRTNDYTVVDNAIIHGTGAKNLSDAADRCWKAILAMDLAGFGRHFRESFEAQVAMFPNMADATIYRIIDQYRDRALGWKLSGAGGGGYLILVAEQPVSGAIRIKIRRKGEI